MALTSTTILYTKKQASIGSIVLDASISETHDANVEVTDHPVESGFNVTDHARPQPETVKIDGYISNTPIPFGAASPRMVSTTQNGETFEFQSMAEGNGTLAKDAYVELKFLKDTGTLLKVVTSLRTYENMIITALTFPRDAMVGNGLKFSASLKEVRVVTSQQTQPTTGEDKTKKKVVQEKKAVETSERAQSLLDRGIHAVL